MVEEVLSFVIEPEKEGTDFRCEFLQRLLGSVGVLPDLHQHHAGVEPVEDEEGQRDPGDDPPGQETEEPGLDALGDVAVRHEGVEHPEGDVGEQHEGDDLSPGLGLLLRSGGADPPARLTDDHALTRHLDEEQRTLDKDEDTVNIQVTIRSKQ